MTATSPIDELRNEIETDVTAATEDLRQIVDAFIQHAETDMDELNGRWTGTVKALEARMVKNLKSGATRLREPIRDQVALLRSELNDLHQSLARLLANQEEAIEKIGKAAFQQTDRELRRIALLSAEVQWSAFLIGSVLILGTAIGVAMTKGGLF